MFRQISIYTFIHMYVYMCILITAHLQLGQPVGACDYQRCSICWWERPSFSRKREAPIKPIDCTTSFTAVCASSVYIYMCVQCVLRNKLRDIRRYRYYGDVFICTYIYIYINIYTLVCINVTIDISICNVMYIDSAAVYSVLAELHKK